MNDGTFQKVGKSSRVLYGPRAMLVCGFSPDTQQRLLDCLESIGLANLAVLFAADADKEAILREIFCRADGSNRGADCGLERAIILAGITENELHQTLSAYRRSGLPRPLWATLTPFSETWTLSALLDELQKERAATENRKG